MTSFLVLARILGTLLADLALADLFLFLVGGVLTCPRGEVGARTRILEQFKQTPKSVLLLSLEHSPSGT